MARSSTSVWSTDDPAFNDVGAKTGALGTAGACVATEPHSVLGVVDLPATGPCIGFGECALAVVSAAVMSVRDELQGWFDKSVRQRAAHENGDVSELLYPLFRKHVVNMLKKHQDWVNVDHPLVGHHLDDGIAEALRSWVAGLDT